MVTSGVTLAVSSKCERNRCTSVQARLVAQFRTLSELHRSADFERFARSGSSGSKTAVWRRTALK